MFVDDNLYTEIRDNIKLAIVASVEVLFLILGFPEDHKRINNISLDKFYEFVCSYNRVQLGKRLNTRTMLVSLSSERRHKIPKEVKHWHSGRKSFTIIEAVQPFVVVENWAEISPSVRFILLALRLAITKDLRSSRDIVCGREKSS